MQSLNKKKVHHCRRKKLYNMDWIFIHKNPKNLSKTQFRAVDYSFPMILKCLKKQNLHNYNIILLVSVNQKILKFLIREK